MEVKNVSLIERLQAKLTLGMPVEQEDVITLAEVVTHNANKLSEISNKQDALISAVTLGFTRINAELAKLNNINVDQKILNEELVTMGEVFSEVMVTLDEDIDVAYSDMNEHLQLKGDGGVLVRHSKVTPDDLIIGEIGNASNSQTVTTGLFNGDSVTVTYGGVPLTISAFHELSA